MIRRQRLQVSREFPALNVWQGQRQHQRRDEDGPFQDGYRQDRQRRQNLDAVPRIDIETSRVEQQINAKQYPEGN